MLHAPTSDRLPFAGSWNRHTPHNTPGVGRPLGIARSRPGGSDGRVIIDLASAPYNILDPGNVNNAGVVLNAAWVDAQNAGNRVLQIPEGIFRLGQNVNGGVYANFSAYVIIRGAGQGRTIFKGLNAFMFGNGSLGTYFVVTSGVIAKGATSFDVTPGSVVAGDVGKNIRITWQDQIDDAAIFPGGAVPVFQTEGLQHCRFQTVKIVGVSGNTVTFTPPIYHQPDSNLWAVGQLDYQSAAHDYIGLEDFTMDAEGGSAYTLIQFASCYAPHLYNIGIENFNGNFPVFMADCVRPEMRGCYLSPGVLGTPSHSGLISETNSGVLVEDCIFDQQFPCVEVNHSSAGLVFAHNFIKGYFNLNHAPWNYGILAVRNIIDGYTLLDGYFGGCEGFTFMQNWFKGGFVMRRFSWKMNVLRNIFGAQGDIANPFYTWEVGQGIANIIGQWDGTDSEFFSGDFPISWKQQCVLLTRESANTGIYQATGTFRMFAGSFKVGIEQAGGGPRGFNDGSYAQLIDGVYINGLERSDKWRLTYNFVLPAEGTVFDIWGPGIANWSEHHLDTPRTAWVKGNLPLQTGGGGETGLPATNPIDEVNDSCVEYLDPTPPDGSSVDVVNWGTCPWHGSGKGFINPADPNAVAISDIPAGKAWLAGPAAIRARLNIDATVVVQPTFSPAAGNFTTPQNIQILCGTVAAVIRYTLDDTGATPSDPTAGSPIYSTPIPLALPSTTIIKARAFKAGLSDSSVASGTFTVAAVPTAPSGLTATPVSSTQINLAWGDNSTNETSFAILHGILSGNLTSLATVGAGVTSFSHTGLSPNSTHFYKVQAVNSVGPSASSNEANATTFITPLSVPTLRSARAPHYAIPGS